MFADSAKIYIRSGKGGDGHVSFMLPPEDLTEVTEDAAGMLYFRWTKV